MGNESITLYHGTTYEFSEIDLNQGNPFKDFGQGFYTTATRSQAVNMARRNYDILRSRYGRHNMDVKQLRRFVYEYSLPKSEMHNLNVKEFSQADYEWVLFVTDNRTHNPHRHSYDIVIGPTANDRTNPTILTYLSEGYGEVGSGRAIEILIELLEPYTLPFQYFFGTQKSVNLLKFNERVEVR
ncbi:DUF3990 domain-containing protein [Lachnospiraceae bacterium ZAX-1]